MAHSPKDLNVSLEVFYNMIIQDKSDEELKSTYNFVDVRDISAVNVAVLKNEKAASERIIITNGASTWQEIRNFVQSLRPDLHASGVLPLGKPESDRTILFEDNPDKRKKILGLELIGKEKTFNNTLADFGAKGWLEKRVDA